MKGITHFVTGIALATCFPEVVARGASGSLLPVLAGVAGILPDTLDFKFVRYFEPKGDELDPGPEPDPRLIAERLATAIERAYHQGEPQRVTLHTVRTGADRWRQYTVGFDGARQEIAVQIGPDVSTAQVAFPAPEMPGVTQARVHLDAPLVSSCSEELTIDIFSGPSLAFEREGEVVAVHFLPWHRRWSHSLTFAAGMALVTGACLGLGEWCLHGSPSPLPLWGGLMVALGLVGHIAEDQLGHLGSNLFYPFTRRRTAGLGLFHSGDAWPNFVVVWGALGLIVHNLNRFSAQAPFDARALFVVVALPLASAAGLSIWRRWFGRFRATTAKPEGEILSEQEELQIG
jgi:membrane-bound metal-dependent hydrolase YbcI (DUF457 family)